MTCIRCGESWTLFEDLLDRLHRQWCKDCAAVVLGGMTTPPQRSPVGAFDKEACDEDSDPGDRWVEFIADAFEEG